MRMDKRPKPAGIEHESDLSPAAESSLALLDALEDRYPDLMPNPNPVPQTEQIQTIPVPKTEQPNHIVAPQNTLRSSDVTQVVENVLQVNINDLRKAACVAAIHGNEAFVTFHLDATLLKRFVNRAGKRDLGEYLWNLVIKRALFAWVY